MLQPVQDAQKLNTEMLGETESPLETFVEDNVADITLVIKIQLQKHSCDTVCHPVFVPLIGHYVADYSPYVT